MVRKKAKQHSTLKERTTTMKKLRVLAILALTLTPAGIPSAGNGDTVCEDVLPADDYGNVIVPPDTSCFMCPGVDVQGNVEIQPGGSLTTDQTTIRGNIEQDGPGFISLMDTIVRGNVELENGNLRTEGGTTIDGNIERDGPGATRLIDTIVGGNVELKSGNLDTAAQTTVVGNIERDGPGHTRIIDTLVEGNVSLKRGTDIQVVSVSVVRGNVEFIRNTLPQQSGIGNSSVGGSVTVDKNTSSELGFLTQGNEIGGNFKIAEHVGPSFVVVNLIGGNLRCKQNEPCTAQLGNVVNGSVECPQCP